MWSADGSILLDYVLNNDVARHIILIDPDSQDSEEAAKRCVAAVIAGSRMIFVGGSTGTDSNNVHETVKAFDKYFHDGEPVNITFRDFYQMLYELKDFGPTIGFLFKEDDGWIYNDDLPEKTLDELPVLGISISSIIEGSDNEIAPVEFKGDFEPQEFWNAMDEISIEVDRIWNEYNFTMAMWWIL